MPPLRKVAVEQILQHDHRFDKYQMEETVFNGFFHQWTTIIFERNPQPVAVIEQEETGKIFLVHSEDFTFLEQNLAKYGSHGYTAKIIILADFRLVLYDTSVETVETHLWDEYLKFHARSVAKLTYSFEPTWLKIQADIKILMNYPLKQPHLIIRHL